MRLFQCQHCRALLYFESSQCVSCGRSLGFLAARQLLSALEPDGWAFRALAESKTRSFRYCANAQHGVCNWLVAADQPELYCAACRHNRMIPDLSIPDNARHWRKIEIAKHRLFYTLLKLRLPLTTKAEDPDGLAFDFVASQTGVPGHTPVMTGHSSGLITINLAEADDVERERQRSRMGEPYRTLLGHFRHEISHYYWGRLIANTPRIDGFRAIFGNEQQDYIAALQNHYAGGPPANWPERFVTAYASSHPWEDFAETWAHYFHMLDTLETANAFGLRVRPKVSKGADLTMAVDFDPHNATMDRIIDSWLPLTFAVNSINRSMGLADLYPFVLAPPVIVKLSFIHDRIHSAAGPRRADQGRGALRAVIASLKRGVVSPDQA
jgi:hypothetical protein